MRPLSKAWESVGGLHRVNTRQITDQVYHPGLHGLGHKVQIHSHHSRMWNCPTEDRVNVESFSQLWLQDKPKPVNLIPGKSVIDFIKDARSAAGDEHHAWSNSSQGIVGSWTFTACGSRRERCCRQDCPGQSWPFTSNLLGPCHQCPQLQGYTPFQWVYGSQPRLDDEDTAAFPIEPTEAIDFTALLQRRQAAEEIARKVQLIAPSTSCTAPRCVDPFRPLLPWT